MSLFARAGENSYTAFHGEWYNILGWALTCTVAIDITIARIIAVRRLHSGLPH